jgi:sugar phosphate permease
MDMQHLLHPTRSKWMRILGVAFVMYVLAFIDRNNIAMAIPAMRQELGLSAADVGFAIGLFYWGYIVLAIPAGRLAGVWSAKRVIAILLVGWSLVSFSTALVSSQTGLIVNRLALGLTESGVLTCTMVLIRAWFTKAERARATMLFTMSQAVAPLIANPLSGLILGFTSWRTMFVLESVPALLWGLVWWWAVADSPGKAAWMDAAERDSLAAALAAETQATAPVRGHWLATLAHPAVLLLTAYNLLAIVGENGVTMWFPTLLKETGMSIGAVGLLAALPYAVGMVLMVVVAFSSDRAGERKWHMIVVSALSGLCLLLSPFAGAYSTFAAVISLSLCVGFFLGRFGPFWSLPTEIVPPAVAGVGVGLINGVGNLGGTVSSWVFGLVRTQTGSFTGALVLGGCLMLAGAVCAMFIPARRPGRG